MKTRIAIGVAALALAGCGGGGGYGGGSSSNSSSSASASSSSAPTLYTFSKDTKGKSNCSGACAKNWPPATSAPELDKSKLTTIKRSDGSSQIALDGRPLYRYVGDKKPGDTNGDGLNAFGGLWKTAGSSSSSSSGSNSSSRSYGY
jgi:predicted lipoprotein with Yx(FWY)xxD motif